MVWSSSKTPTISQEPAAVHTGKVTLRMRPCDNGPMYRPGKAFYGALHGQRLIASS